MISGAKVIPTKSLTFPTYLIYNKVVSIDKRQKESDEMKVMTISVVSNSEEITRKKIVDELRNEDLVSPVSLDSINHIILSEYAVDVVFKTDVTVRTDELFHFINNHEQIVHIDLH